MVHGEECVVVCPLASFLNQVRVALAHGNGTAKENHRCRKAREIPSFEFGKKLVKKEEAEEMEKPWFEDSFGIGAANEGDLAGRALDQTHLKVPLYGALGNDRHWFLPSSNNFHCAQLTVCDGSCEATKWCFGNCMDFYRKDFSQHVGPD